MKAVSIVRTILCMAIGTIAPLRGFSQSIFQPGSQTGRTALFTQPKLDGITDNFHVPEAEHRWPTEHQFNLLLWQPNPNRADGELTPTKWNAGEKTGFYPSGALDQHQAAFRDGPNETTVQIDGDTVGVYLNSHDLPSKSATDKLMIAPAYKPSKEQIVYPFAHSGTALVNSLELQIPVASDMNRTGNYTYASPIFVFEDRLTHAQISYGINIFHHALRPGRPQTQDLLKKMEIGPYDEPSHTFQVGNPVALGSRVITVLAGSSLYQDQPWKGWRLFSFAITERNFVTALHALKEKEAPFTGSENPADYALVEWHLNAEMKFGSGPAELGWSMRRASINLVPENQLSVMR